MGFPRALGYARVITENPNRKGSCYSRVPETRCTIPWTDGITGSSSKKDLPPSPVSWIVGAKELSRSGRFPYGRGFYILEILRRLSSRAAPPKHPCAFTKPRSTYRLLRGGRALLNYSLKEPAKDAMKLEILDSRGNVIREMKQGKGQAG